MQARIESSAEHKVGFRGSRQLAKVLLADSDLASRLAVKSLLIAAGYEVQGAASAAEALARLDEAEAEAENEGDFQLVLADLRSESEEAGPRLLAYARQKEFRPATALLASDISGRGVPDHNSDHIVHVSNDDVSNLLDRVAELISQRADRRIRQVLRKAC
jgi:CheY-like chemotaxis protein